MSFARVAALGVLLLGWLPPAAVVAQPAGGDTPGTPVTPSTPAAGASNSVGLPASFAGAPPPQGIDVISRSSLGRTTVRAVRLSTPLKIDGKLDEEIYMASPAMSDFIQQDPKENVPATEKTEVWVFFDRDNVYVVGKCWDTHPERMVMNEMRRDGSGIPRNENFAFILDTFYDHRNGVLFEMNPLGGRFDAQFSNERTLNTSWNPVWEIKSGRFDQGWIVETRIPFKSLRYKPGIQQVWGFNVRRKNQWKNEISYLTAIPAALGQGGHFRGVSLAATLVGIEAPSSSKNLEIKPYVTGNVSSDTAAVPRVENKAKSDWGVDVKYGIKGSLTADLTYNTDFAQVEADEQQVNLTRFNLFFPEKREFFLENLGTFEFGGAGVSTSANAQTTSLTAGFSDTPTFFYSRRIGLDRSGGAVPIVGGGRLTGRLGRYTLGAMEIRSDEAPSAGAAATNFSVLRVKRDVLRKSTIGAIFTGRSVSERRTGSNEAYGVDGTFGFFDNLTINTYWAQTRSEGLTSDDRSYRAQMDYAGDKYGVQLERMAVGANFNPEVGFVRHPDMVRNYANVRFSPRPKRSKWARRVNSAAWVDHIENGGGRRDWESLAGEFSLDFQNGDRFNVRSSNNYEYLPVALRLAPGVTAPVGGYDTHLVQTGYNFGAQRKLLSGNVSLEKGTFYGGDKTTFTVTQGRLSFPPTFSVEPSYSVNTVDIPQGAFTTHLIGTRLNVMLTPLMFGAALVQYNSTSHTVSANARFRWEYQPGSELFVVLNETHDTLGASGGAVVPGLINRAFIVKVNKLIRF